RQSRAVDAPLPPTPPDDVCAKINAQVRANPALGTPHFDFAGHVRSREYTLHTYDLRFDGPSPDSSSDAKFEPSPSVGAAFLDAGVARLLPPLLELPPELRCAANDTGVGTFAIAP